MVKFPWKMRNVHLYDRKIIFQIFPIFIFQVMVNIMVKIWSIPITRKIKIGKKKYFIFHSIQHIPHLKSDYFWKGGEGGLHILTSDRAESSNDYKNILNFLSIWRKSNRKLFENVQLTKLITYFRKVANQIYFLETYFFHSEHFRNFFFFKKWKKCQF